MTLSSDVITFQWCAIFALALVAAAGGFIPYLFKRSTKFEQVMSYLNCASAGILLGVALLHIIPETGEAINEACGGYPFSYCVTFCGMILMVMMLKLGHNHNHEHCEEHHHEEHNAETGQTDQGHSSSEELISKELSVDKMDIESHNGHTQKRWISVVMLMIGLFIHDVSEGLALGFTQELMPAVYMFIAIFLHKWCDVTCEVICGIREGLSLKENMLMMIPLVLASPVAEFIAFMICLNSDDTVETSGALDITEDFFMSFACGTFLTIAFVEIIGGEFSHI